MRAAELSFRRHGAQHFPGLAVPLLDRLRALAERIPQNRAGTRIVGDVEAAELLSPASEIGRAVEGLAGSGPKPVRAILFDKSDKANWALGWHQDRTIAVRHRCETIGYGPWTLKQGIPHVEPPFDLIERMITVRIHLDRVDADNAPLLVGLGTHHLGRVPVDALDESVRSGTTFACLADAGDVWAYSTPILHASHPARLGRRRRVLQADYSADTLPGGLEWMGL